MTTEELIEKYLTAIEEVAIAEADGEPFDDWSIAAADAAMALKGHTVTATVKWHNGRTTDTTGTVISIAGDKVYLESALGPVEGDAMSMAAA